MAILTAKEARDIADNQSNPVKTRLKEISDFIRLAAEDGDVECKTAIHADPVSLKVIISLRKYGYDVDVKELDGIFYCVITW